MNKKTYLLTEFIVTSIGQFSFFVSPFILTKIYAIQLPKSEMGNLALWLISITALTILSSGPISASVTRFTEAAKKSNNLYFLYQSATYLFLKQIKLLIPPLVFYVLFILLSSNNNSNILSPFLAYITFICIGLTAIRVAIFAGLRDRKSQLIFYLTDSLIKPILAFLLLKLLSVNSTTALFAASLSHLITLPIQVILFDDFLYAKHQTTNISKLKFIDLFRSSKTLQTSMWTRKISGFAKPYQIWGIPGFLQSLSDLYFLKLFAGSSSAAALAILFKVIYTPITMAMAIPGTYLEPILYQKAESKTTRDSKFMSIFKFSHMIVLLFGLIIVIPLCSIFKSNIILLMSSSKYLYVQSYLPYMALAGLIFAASQFRIGYLIAVFGSSYCLPIRVTYSIAAIIMNLLFSYYFGIKGSVFAILLSSIFLLLFSSLKQHPKNLSIMN